MEMQDPGWGQETSHFFSEPNTLTHADPQGVTTSVLGCPQYMNVEQVRSPTKSS